MCVMLRWYLPTTCPYNPGAPLYPVSSEYTVQQHTPPLSFIPAVILLIPIFVFPILLLIPPYLMTLPVLLHPLILLQFPSSSPFLLFPQAIMTIPIDVKDMTVSNSTMSNM